MTDFPKYDDLDPRIHGKHKRIFDAAHIRQTQIDAAGKKFADDMPEWAHWYLLAVNGGREEAVATDLDEHGIKVWLPKMIERKRSISRGKRRKCESVETRVIIFKGFVLVHIAKRLNFDYILSYDLSCKISPSCSCFSRERGFDF